MKKFFVWVAVSAATLSLILFVPLSVSAEQYEGPDIDGSDAQSPYFFWEVVYLPTMEYLTPNLADNEFYHEYSYYQALEPYGYESPRCGLMTEDLIKAFVKYGQNAPYQQGYQDGKTDAIADDFSLKEMIFSIIDAPFRVVREALSFEIFGIEVSSLVLGLLSVTLVIFVIRRLRA